MKKSKLKDVSTLFAGYPFDGHLYSSEGVRVVRGDNVTIGSLRWDADKRWNLPFKEKDEYSLKDEDIVIGMDGSRVGRNRAMVLESDLPLFLAQRVACVRNNERSNQKYLYYSIFNSRFEQYINTIHTGTSIPHISLEQLGDYSFPLPELNVQKRIGEFLFLLDKKITLNMRMNAELEAMAKLLYDYWFVQFDFPDENGNPYKSSGGKMVYNSTLKREIPAGWDDCEIKDLSEVVNGATPLTTNLDNFGNDIIWITPNDLSNQKAKFISCGERSITQKGYDSCSTTLMPAGSVLMSSRAPIGLMAIAEVDLCTNQGFKNFVPFDMTDNYFIYYYVKEHMAQVEQLGAGTTFREVSRDTILKFPILKISDRELYSKWYEHIDSICKEQKNLLLQIRHLTHLRDSLLPMLMNGQVTVE